MSMSLSCCHGNASSDGGVRLVLPLAAEISSPEAKRGKLQGFWQTLHCTVSTGPELIVLGRPSHLPSTPHNHHTPHLLTPARSINTSVLFNRRRDFNRLKRGSSCHHVNTRFDIRLSIDSRISFSDYLHSEKESSIHPNALLDSEI